MKIHLNTKHLIDRAAERVRTYDGTPYRLRADDLHRWRDEILQNSPDDWRFTERARDFILTVVTDEQQIKFLGTSWRWTRGAKRLDEEVTLLAQELAEGKSQKRNGSTPWRVCILQRNVIHMPKFIMS